MRHDSNTRKFIAAPLATALLLTLFVPARAQSTAVLRSRVGDLNGAVVNTDSLRQLQLALKFMV